MKTIGIITKTHGFEGAVVVRSYAGKAEEPETGEPVFIVIDGIPVPFFTREAWSPTSDTVVISFDDYLTAESVLPFKGCEVRIESVDQPDDELAQLTDYQINDTSTQFKGTITRIYDTPGQIIAEVRSMRGVVLIPMHPDLIRSIDHKGKIIFMSLPAGLTGINE